MKKALIVGAGIIGATTAYHLKKKGYRVDMIDRHESNAAESSYQNGGQLSVSNSETWTTWSNIYKGMLWMTKSDAPLYMNMKHWSPEKIKWILGFLGATMKNTHKVNTEKTIQYALRSRELYLQAAEEFSVNFDARQDGIVHFYKSDKAFQKARNSVEFYRNTGWGRETISKDEVFALCPQLNDHGDIVGGTYTKGDITGDCRKMTKALIKNCVDNRFTMEMDRDRLNRYAQEYAVTIIAAGAYTPKLVPGLNIYPIKGYSLDLKIKGELPAVSLLDDESKIVTSSLKKTFRVAGTAELSGWDHSIFNWQRTEPLQRWYHTNIGHVIKEQEYYSCLRPMTPDMLPLVTKVGQVYVNSGSGHLGWTMGMALGEELVEKINE